MKSARDMDMSWGPKAKVQACFVDFRLELTRANEASPEFPGVPRSSPELGAPKGPEEACGQVLGPNLFKFVVFLFLNRLS